VTEAGPLAGTVVIEVAGLAPVPFACMMLADMGADVIRVDRPAGAALPAAPDESPLGRGRRSIVIDLKQPAGVGVLLRLTAGADVLVEGFRPGVAERLGFGPEDCLGGNGRLVYARLTGWGQDGPLARTAGHDIDYIAMAGALAPIGAAGGPPVPPLNLVADFGGGGMLCVAGVLAALLERERSGRGQVVDAAMVDGSALLTAFLHGLRAAGEWRDERGANLLDGGAPFYTTYLTADGGYMAVGALEPGFYADLLARLGLDGGELPAQYDRAAWPALRARLAAAFATRTRAEWAEVFDGTDACVAPVLSPAEAAGHPHNLARGVFTEVAGAPQPAPAPRFSRSAAGPPAAAPPRGAHTDQVLAGLGMSPAEISGLRERGAVG